MSPDGLYIVGWGNTHPIVILHTWYERRIIIVEITRKET